LVTIVIDIYFLHSLVLVSRIKIGTSRVNYKYAYTCAVAILCLI
jgi:hypothetical protein